LYYRLGVWIEFARKINILSTVQFSMAEQRKRKKRETSIAFYRKFKIIVNYVWRRRTTRNYCEELVLSLSLSLSQSAFPKFPSNFGCITSFGKFYPPGRCKQKLEKERETG
jgi:midasin (ATPase involved in ribosome maturation)